MKGIKYFINTSVSGATDLAEKLRYARIDFDSAPTSGPLTLWVDREVVYGIDAITKIVNFLIEKEK